MGSNSSKGGDLFVQTDKPFYNPGDTVSGHVYVNMMSMFPGDIIYLKVKGYEKCYFSEKKTRWEEKRQPDGTTKSENVEYYEHHEAKNEFYSHKFSLHTWNGGIPIGQYSIPFSFVLQNPLPGSFHEEGQYGTDKEHYKAKIQYTIKAESTIPTGFEKMKHKQELIVREPVKQMQQGQEGQMIKNTKIWCCVDQGQSSIKSYFENNAYMPGETAQVITEIDNSKCELAIKSVRGKLVKTIRLESKTQSQTIKKTINSVNFGGIGARGTKIGNDALRTPVQLVSMSKPIQPSTSGNLVSCQYTLTIESDMDGVTCCAEDPNVTVPIQLISPPPPNYGVVQQPPNWNPTVLAVNNLTFSSGAKYGGADLSVNLNVGGMASQPAMNAGFNQPPGAGVQMNVQVNDNNQQQGFNQPPGAGVQMNVNTSTGFNQPPNAGVQMNMQVTDNTQQQQQGFNQPPQGQPQQQQGFNQPPQGQVQMNMQVTDNTQQQGFNQQAGVQMNMQVTDNTQQQGFNQPPQGQQQQQGFNQPPQGQVQMNVQATDNFAKQEHTSNYNQQQQAGVSMNVNVSDNQGFNQPPQQQQGVQMNVQVSGDQQGFNQPPGQQQQQGFNQPPGQQNAQVNMNMNMGVGMDMNITMDTDTSQTGFNNNNNNNF